MYSVFVINDGGTQLWGRYSSREEAVTEANTLRRLGIACAVGGKED